MWRSGVARSAEDAALDIAHHESGVRHGRPGLERPVSGARHAEVVAVLYMQRIRDVSDVDSEKLLGGKSRVKFS